MKVVVNSTNRGLQLSHEAVMMYCELAKIRCYPHQYDWDRFEKHWIYWTVPPDSKEGDPKLLDVLGISRTDPVLVKIIESINSNANSNHDTLGQLGSIFKIVEIPDDVNFEIVFDETLDREIVREISRTWF